MLHGIFNLSLSDAVNVPFYVADTDGTPLEGLTDGDFTVKGISKAGGSPHGLTATINELADGWYNCALTGSETDELGVLTCWFWVDAGDSPTGIASEMAGIQIAIDRDTLAFVGPVVDLGDVPLGSTQDWYVNATLLGILTTLSGGTVVAYVGDSTTQISAGLTLTADFDGVTGLCHVRAVLTSGNGYADDTDVTFVLSAGTVGPTDVAGQVIGRCSIQRSAPYEALTTAVPDAIPALGDRPSIAQAAYMMVQFFTNRALPKDALTLTIYKPDGTTELFTCTVDDDDDVRSTTRAT